MSRALKIGKYSTNQPKRVIRNKRSTGPKAEGPYDQQIEQFDRKLMRPRTPADHLYINKNTSIKEIK